MTDEVLPSQMRFCLVRGFALARITSCCSHRTCRVRLSWPPETA